MDRHRSIRPLPSYDYHRSLAQLLAKFRIVAADVVIIPDVTKKAESATRDEFTKMIEGQDIDQSELMEEKEKTNRYVKLTFIGW